MRLQAGSTAGEAHSAQGEGCELPTCPEPIGVTRSRANRVATPILEAPGRAGEIKSRSETSRERVGSYGL